MREVDTLERKLAEPRNTAIADEATINTTIAMRA